MNDTSIRVIAVAILLIVAFVSYSAGKDRACKNCRYYQEAKQKDALAASASILLMVADEFNIVRKLRYEGSCKEALQEEIDLIFAFGDLKDPEMVKARLKAHYRKAKSEAEDSAEQQAIAETLAAILNKVDPNWQDE